MGEINSYIDEMMVETNTLKKTLKLKIDYYAKKKD